MNNEGADLIPDRMPWWESEMGAVYELAGEHRGRGGGVPFVFKHEYNSSAAWSLTTSYL